MFRVITTYTLVLLAVPALGLVYAHQLANAGPEFLDAARFSEIGFLVTLGVLLFVLGGYGVAIRTLARPRDRLARYFPIVIRVSLALLVLVFLAQGALLLWTLGEVAIAGGGNSLGLWVALIAAGLIATSCLMVFNWRQLFAVVPLDVRGVLVDRGRFSALWERVDRLSQVLGAAPPKRLILGLEPTAFVTSGVINLVGTGSLPRVETLYLPVCGLRLWSEAELDAVIGHELGHFRGEDLRYSERFVPALRSLAVSLESVQSDSTRASGWFRAARIPAFLVLAAMLGAFYRLISTTVRERELAADQAAATVSTGRELLGAIGKICVLRAEWNDFWSALADFVTFGRTRANFCEDLLERASVLCRRVCSGRLAELLLGSQQPHPFDTHPPFAARAAALGIDAGPVFEASVTELRLRTEPTATQLALEEEITRIIAESVCLPGRSLQLDSTPGLPVELARRVRPAAERPLESI